jgi:hypothetical protein
MIKWSLSLNYVFYLPMLFKETSYTYFSIKCSIIHQLVDRLFHETHCLLAAYQISLTCLLNYVFYLPMLFKETSYTYFSIKCSIIHQLVDRLFHETHCLLAAYQISLTFLLNYVFYLPMLFKETAYRFSKEKQFQ